MTFLEIKNYGFSIAIQKYYYSLNLDLDLYPCIDLYPLNSLFLHLRSFLNSVVSDRLEAGRFYNLHIVWLLTLINYFRHRYSYFISIFGVYSDTNMSFCTQELIESIEHLYQIWVK